MKIAIISDTHDNLANFLKIIKWLNSEKIQLLLHCGDICNQDTLNEARKAFERPASAKGFGEAREIKFVMGNKELHSENFPEVGEIEIDNKRIAFTHLPEKAKELAETRNPSASSGQVPSASSGQRYDLVFYGHSHKPWKEVIGNCKLVNPGEAAGLLYKPTFAIYDTATDNLELKIIEKL